MVKYENRCCGCATENYPCLGERCDLFNVEVHYCDNPKCREELDEIYEVDDKEFCEECLKEMFRK